MTVRWSPGSVVAATAVVLLLASACDGKRVAATGRAASSRSEETQTAPAERSALPLTKEQLTAALLTTKDLPAGSEVTPGGGQDDSDDPTGDPGCRKASAAFDALDRGTHADQVAHATVVFWTADNVDGGDESLSSFTTEAAAKREFSEYVAAADACHSFGSKLGSTTTMLAGKPLPLPVVGDESRAYRYVGASEGETVQVDMMAFRVGGTLALLTAARVGGPPESELLERIANEAAAKLA
jgi:hypothetical protein